MSSPLDQFKDYSSKVEEAVLQYSITIKRYLPKISRLLIVFTFYEDSTKLILQWGDQNRYLINTLGFPPFTSEIFLFLNIVTMLACSTLVVRKKCTKYAIGGLLGVVISQWLGYGMLFNLKFILYNFSIVGGLLMLYAEHIMNINNQTFTGLLNISSLDSSIYATLAGRILLIFLFLAFCFAGEMTLLRVVFCAVVLVTFTMAMIGFRHNSTALLIALFLSIIKVFMDNWWALHHNVFFRDHIKQSLFQVIYTVGSLLLLDAA